MKNAVPLLALIAVVVAASLFLLKDSASDAGASKLTRTEVESVVSRGETTVPDDLAMVATSGARDERAQAVMAPAKTATKAGGEPAEGDASAEAPKAALVGRVTDGAGRPVNGAEVRLSTSFNELLVGLSSRRDGLREDTVVQTDANGHFETDAPIGLVRVSIGKDGFAPLERDIELDEGKRVDLGDLRLAEGVRLSGRVVDDAGNGVVGATVMRKRKADSGIQVYGGRPGPTVAVTDGRGRFEITSQASGPYEFVVMHDDHPPGTLSGSTERAGEMRDDLLVTLSAGATIEGRVVGLPVARTGNLRVTARLEDGGSLLGFFLDERPGGPVSARVDESGRFILRGLAAGSTVGVSLFDGQARFGGTSRRGRSVSAAAGDLDVRLTYSEGATIRFRVVDGDGAPIESIQVGAGFEFPQQRVRRNQVSENGEVTIAHLWPDEGGQEIKLELDATGFEPFAAKGIVVLPGEDHDLGAIVLEQRPQVILTVVSRETGAPIEGAVVTMRAYRDPADDQRTIRRSISFSTESDSDSDESHSALEIDGEVRGISDEDGLCALDAIPGQTVEFLILHPDYAETVDGPLNVARSGSSTEYEVALDPGGSVRISVVDETGVPVQGATVERRGAEVTMPMGGEIELGGPIKSDVTGDSGVVTLTGLPAGELYFRVKRANLGGGGGLMMVGMGLPGMGGEEDGAEWTSVVVRPGETSECTLIAPLRGVVAGTLTEVGVPLAGASVTLRRPKTGPMASMMAFGPQGPKALTDARGDFRFDGIEEGKYELAITHPTRAMETVQPFEAEGRETEVDVDLDVTIVEGGVYDENGDPVVGALVRPEKAASGGPQMPMVMVMITDDGGGGGATVMTSGGTNANQTRTDEDGQFTLRGVASRTKIKIKATADGYDEAFSEAFEVSAGATRDGIDVQFSKPGKILVRLENSPGGLMVMLRRRGEFRGQPRIEQIPGDEVTIDGVEPGEWTVQIIGGPSGVSIDPDEVEVTVVGGETVTADFTVP